MSGPLWGMIPALVFSSPIVNLKDLCEVIPLFFIEALIQRNFFPTPRAVLQKSAIAFITFLISSLLCRFHCHFVLPRSSCRPSRQHTSSGSSA